LIRGLGLPEDVLDKIYVGNLSRLAGDAPRPLNVSLAIEACERWARIAQELSGQPGDETEAAKVAQLLTAGVEPG